MLMPQPPSKSWWKASLEAFSEDNVLPTWTPSLSVAQCLQALSGCKPLDSRWNHRSAGSFGRAWHSCVMLWQRMVSPQTQKRSVLSGLCLRLLKKYNPFYVPVSIIRGSLQVLDKLHGLSTSSLRCQTAWDEECESLIKLEGAITQAPVLTYRQQVGQFIPDGDGL